MGKRKKRAMDWREGGGELFESKGSENPMGERVISLARRELGLESVLPFEVPKTQPNLERVVGDTPNHRLLYLVAKYGAAWVTGDAGELEDYRYLLHRFFERQTTTHGHCWAEWGTTSHAQLWYLGVLGARVIALCRGDQVILDDTGQWCRRDVTLLELHDWHGHPVTGGNRMAIKGVVSVTNDLRTVCYSQMKGVEPPERSLTKNRSILGPAFYYSSYNAGAWFARALLGKGDDLGGTIRGRREQPVVNGRIAVYRDRDNLLSVLDIDQGSEAVFWAGVIDGELVHAPLHEGRIRNIRNPYPQPAGFEDVEPIIVQGVSA